MGEYTFNPGDSVIVRETGPNYEAANVRTISSVLKRYVVLGDGTKWDFRGNPVPKPRGWTTIFKRLEPATPESIEKVVQQNEYRKKWSAVQRAFQKLVSEDKVSHSIIDALHTILCTKKD